VRYCISFGTQRIHGVKRCIECGSYLIPDEYGMYDGLCEWCYLHGEDPEDPASHNGEGHPWGKSKTSEETEGDLPDLSPDYC